MPVLVHPLVVHFPIALWLTSALFDVLYLWRGDRWYVRGAFILIGLGVLTAIVSIASGYRDLFFAASQGLGQEFLAQHRAHGLTSLAAALVYLASLVIRWRNPNVSRGSLVVLAATGALLIAWAGWLGGELRLRM